MENHFSCDIESPLGFCDHLLFEGCQTSSEFQKGCTNGTKHYSDICCHCLHHHHHYYHHPVWSIQLYWALLVVGWPALVPSCHVGPCCFETPDCTRPDLIAVAFVVRSADTLSNDQWNQSHTLRDDLTWQGNIFLILDLTAIWYWIIKVYHCFQHGRVSKYTTGGGFHHWWS